MVPELVGSAGAGRLRGGGPTRLRIGGVVPRRRRTRPPGRGVDPAAAGRRRTGAERAAGADRGAGTGRGRRRHLFVLPDRSPEAEVAARRDRGVTTFAMELVPRISRAQPMDALSSQAMVVGLPRCGRRGRAAATVLPAEHDRRRHRTSGRGAGPRRRGRRAAGHRHRETAGGRGPGLRRASGGRRGDRLPRSGPDRPGPAHAGGSRRLRPGDERGTRAASAGAARPVRRGGGRPDHHRRRTRSAPRRSW